MPVQQSTASAARALLRRCKPYGAPLDNNGKTQKVARPPNAFILFRSDYIAKHEGDKHQRSLSQAAGATWNLLTDAEKLPYQRKAQEIAERFKRENHDYKWNTPTASSSKASRSRTKKSSSSSSSPSSSSASGSKSSRTKSSRTTSDAVGAAPAPASPITNSDASIIDWSELGSFSAPSPSPSSWSSSAVTSGSWESAAPSPAAIFTEDDFAPLAAPSALIAAPLAQEPAPILEEPVFYHAEPPYVPNDPYFCNEVYPYPTADPSSPEFAAQLQQFAILPHRQDIAYDTFLCDGSSW